jgi:hypothetical protein
LIWVNDIVRDNPELSHLAGLASRIEEDIDQDTNSVFDTSKSLIESSCKTFLKDSNIMYSEQDDVPRLLKLVISHSLETKVLSEISSEEEKSLKMVIGGLVGTVGGVCYLRNKLGIIGHGRDASIQPSHPLIARFIAQIADSISGFVLSLSKEIRNFNLRTRHYYSDYEDFNQWFDDMMEPCVIGENKYPASEVLYKTDHEAYVEALLSYMEDK